MIVGLMARRLLIADSLQHEEIPFGVIRSLTFLVMRLKKHIYVVRSDSMALVEEGVTTAACGAKRFREQAVGRGHGF